MTVVARDLKNNDTTDAGFDLLTDPTTIGVVTGDAGITRILFGSTGVDGGFAQGSATDGMLVNLGSNNDVTVTGTVTVDTELPAAAALADNAANPTTALVGSCLLAFDGTTWDRVTNGGGVEATALRVTIASDSTGLVSVDDNGGSLTVDGTVAATQSGTWNITNVSGTVSLPTGASTLAEQQSQTTALQLIDNIVLAEDAVHGSGDPGVQMLVVRKDSGIALAADGDYTPMQVDASGNLRVNVAAGGAGDGAILDGVSGSIKATVLDYTNSNPLAVRLTDTNGDFVSAGAGTQYTEDAAAAVDPVGTAMILVRQDTLSGTTVSADGDNIAARASSTGAQYVEISSGTTKVAAGGGTEATALRVTVASDSTGVLSIDDNGSSLTVDNGGTFATQDSQAITDNGAFTDGTSKVFAAGFIYDEVAGTALTENDVAAARLNVNRAQVAAIEDGATRARYATVTASNALKVDGSAVTQPVSLSGVSTLTEQQTQTTALQLIDDIVYTDDTSTHSTGTSKGALIMGAATPTDAAVNANDIGAVAMSLNRELHVSVQTALPTGSNAIGRLAANSGIDIGDVDVTSIVPGTGATNLGKAEDVGHVTGDVGVMALAVRTDTQAARAGATDDYIPLTTDSLGNLYVRDYPQTTGGLSISRDLDADETETEAKSTAGQVYGYYFANTHATAWRYLKFYNDTAANVTVGTTTPVLTFALPFASAGHVEFSKGITFGTAICYAVTTGVADNDTGAPGANECIVNVFYK